MSDGDTVVSPGSVESVIFSIRGRRVMLDSDLAKLYGVTTTRLNEQVGRNPDRFPPDFMFSLSQPELAVLISQKGTSKGQAVLRYLDRNPIRHGLVDDPAVYAWSSCATYALGVPNSLITLHPSHLTLTRCPKVRQRHYRAPGADRRSSRRCARSSLDDRARHRHNHLPRAVRCTAPSSLRNWTSQGAKSLTRLLFGTKYRFNVPGWVTGSQESAETGGPSRPNARPGRGAGEGKPKCRSAAVCWRGGQTMGTVVWPYVRVAGVVLTLGLPLLMLGCNAKAGWVNLDTVPTEAAVYVDGKSVGTTPLLLYLDLQKPGTLKILKEGYTPLVESFGVAWVRNEYRAGNYSSETYTSRGGQEKRFNVRTVRVLTEDPQARQQLRDFTAWADSMVGKNSHEVVTRLGLPTEIIELPNGNKSMIFKRGIPERTSRFETDARGIVIRWSH